MRIILLYTYYFILINAALAQKPDSIRYWEVMDTVSLNKGEFTVVEGIKFEDDKAELKEESLKVLDQLVAFFDANPNVYVEIANHLDCRDKRENIYALTLSEKRAQEVMDYLVYRGVERSRLMAKGYEAYKPLVSCEEISGVRSRKERKILYEKNRRTEIRIFQLSNQ